MKYLQIFKIQIFKIQLEKLEICKISQKVKQRDKEMENQVQKIRRLKGQIKRSNMLITGDRLNKKKEGKK